MELDVPFDMSYTSNLCTRYWIGGIKTLSRCISFEDGGGGGGDGWFDLCKNVFSQTSGDRIFYHTACSIIHYEKYLFLVNDIFGGVRYFLVSPISPPLPRLKSRMVGHRD